MNNSYVSNENAYSKALDVLSSMLSPDAFHDVKLLASYENTISMASVVEKYQVAGITDAQIVQICIESDSSEAIEIVGHNLSSFRTIGLFRRGKVDPDLGDDGQAIPGSENILYLAIYPDARKVEAICKEAGTFYEGEFSLEQITDLLDVEDYRIISDLAALVSTPKGVEIAETGTFVYDGISIAEELDLTSEEMLDLALNAPDYYTFRCRIEKLEELVELERVAAVSKGHNELADSLNEELFSWLGVQDEEPELVGAAKNTGHGSLSL